MRRRRSSRRIALRRAAFAAACLGLLAALIGAAFAGSRSTLAEGTEIAGLDVGGVTVGEATRLLVARAESVEDVPVVFAADGAVYRIAASQLGVVADWRAAVRAAAAENDGFGPVRGYRRLHTRLFGAAISPPLSVYAGALDYKLDQISAAVGRAGVDAKLVRNGLSIDVVPGRAGSRLDREAASELIVRTLGGFDRSSGVQLPVVHSGPKVTAAALVRAARQARTALSAPVQVTYGATRWRLPRWRLAELLQLPSDGETSVSIAGRGAEAYLERLARTVGRAPRDAVFAVTANGRVRVVPSAPGLQLDVPATVRALTAAAFSPTNRVAPLAVRVAQPARTTADARKMGIREVVSSYTTTYGGTAGRLHNVQLVAELLDGALIAPGATFSFNDTTGERNAAKGFETAPVIINGELQNGIGGGVCQVSTTVFNAAFEAGLPIEQRHNHALYISHYPLGRDATVNYPDLDLRFGNDTEHWLQLRAFVSPGSLTVNLYGTPVDRRVESETSPLTVTGKVPVKKLEDPTLVKGKRVVELVGAPPRATEVHRTVYGADGTLLYENTWRSAYVGEPTVVRVGTKRPPKKPKPALGKDGKPEAAAVAGGPAGVRPSAPKGAGSPTGAPTLP